MGRSRFIFPDWTRVMRPVAVKGFEMEASEYMVCSSAGMRRARSAQPDPLLPWDLAVFGNRDSEDRRGCRVSELTAYGFADGIEWVEARSAAGSNSRMRIGEEMQT